MVSVETDWKEMIVSWNPSSCNKQRYAGCAPDPSLDIVFKPQFESACPLLRIVHNLKQLFPSSSFPCLFWSLAIEQCFCMANCRKEPWVLSGKTIRSVPAKLQPPQLRFAALLPNLNLTRASMHRQTVWTVAEKIPRAHCLEVLQINCLGVEV